MYVVVVRNIGDGILRGVVTWSSFESELAFNAWYGEKMRTRYEVVDKGVTKERALELCSNQERNRAALLQEAHQY